MFILNPLCRGFSPSVFAQRKDAKKAARRFANIEANESNNEADDQSFYPGSSRATQRQTRKNKMKGWFF
jgi:hypothetical protein